MHTDAAVASVQKRTVTTLVGVQALGGIGVTSGIAVATLLAEEILGSASLAGLAQTTQVLGAAVASFLVARVMSMRGRRVGLAVGLGTSAVGAALCILAGVLDSFVVLLLGTLLLGSATASNGQARYAATDLAPAAHRARALSIVVWATTLGAVIGPNLTGPGAAVARVLGVPELAGPFVFSVVAVTAAVAVAWVWLRPDPLLMSRELAASRGEVVNPHARLGQVWRVVRPRPRALAAMAAIATAHAVMVSVMVMTPLHMHHGGADLRVIGFVISMHVLGMFAFSPIVGVLADRLGRAAVLALGGGLLLVSVVLAGSAPAGQSVALTAGLFLLGLGWSCCLVASSALLVDSVPFDDRPGVQGASDLLMNGFAALGGALAGWVVATAGYDVLNVAAGVLALVVLVAAAVARAASREPVQ
ncbi:MAG: MFS transporter [Nocardioidaceae bacterium]